MHVKPDDVGTRLDLFLKNRLPEVSRKQAKRLLDAGQVRINGRKVIIASWKLQAGDRVTLATQQDKDPDPAGYFLKVYYEDPSLLVVEKDAGIPCEKTPQALKPSLVEIINAYLQKIAPSGTRPYLGLMHRLDTDTSGLMIYTRKKEANTLAEQFSSHRIERRYLAIVEGGVAQETGSIRKKLVKEDGKGGRKVRIAGQGEEGRFAQTDYRVLERYSQATLLEVIVKTGRTHQVRVHFASIGHPLVGERLYRPEGPKSTVRLKRQALHASFLGFHHPVTGEKMELKSELPRDLRRLVDRLRIKG